LDVSDAFCFLVTDRVSLSSTRCFFDGVEEEEEEVEVVVGDVAGVEEEEVVVVDAASLVGSSPEVDKAFRFVDVGGVDPSASDADLLVATFVAAAAAEARLGGSLLRTIEGCSVLSSDVDLERLKAILALFSKAGGCSADGDVKTS